MPLKPLAEFNADKMQEYSQAQQPRAYPNGIACPKCGSELLDSNERMLLSYPAKREIHCADCGWTGHRLA